MEDSDKALTFNTIKVEIFKLTGQCDSVRHPLIVWAIGYLREQSEVLRGITIDPKLSVRYKLLYMIELLIITCKYADSSDKFQLNMEEICLLNRLLNRLRSQELHA